MKKRFLLLIIPFLMIALNSCEEDDICMGGGTPFMTVVFTNNLGSEKMADTLTIESDISISFSNPDTIYFRNVLDSIKLPLGGLNDNQTFFRIRRGSNSLTDILTVNYNSETAYVSKACGFRLIYTDLGFNTTFNRIESIEPGETNILEDETATNLYIRLSD